MKSINWKYKLVQAAWILIAVGTFILMGAAIQKKEKKSCKEITIEITGGEKEMFINENDVLYLLNSNGNIEGKSMQMIDLRSFENALKKNIWIKNAELFFDNNQVLHVHIEERMPIARVFTDEGTSFYVDSTALRLPLSDRLTARVPVFTGFTSTKDTLASSDSAMLQGVVKLGKYILADSFWMAQVAQINITPQARFEMIPTIGNQIIELGDTNNLANKFTRLYAFYKQVWLQNGINAYEKLELQFSNQIVGVRKGASKQWIDSAAKLNTAIAKPLPYADSTSATRVPSVEKSVAPAIITSGKKNVVGNKQNKVANNSLSNNRSVKKSKPKARKPKAVMKKVE